MPQKFAPVACKGGRYPDPSGEAIQELAAVRTETRPRLPKYPFVPRCACLACVGSRLEILWKRHWTSIGARFVGTAAPPVDIAVLALERSISEPAPFDLSAVTVLSERLFIVGFPYSLGTNLPTNINAGYPVPLLKSGILSG
jgi:hypothetical protein